ncbi:hypothetical protein Gocc_0814 [Gaiella occulta]|uniref:Peptidase family M3 n=1 Tax=Gaiella occulta TaxID=1002870 RepID=A0A7M2YY58_9ACTN|nr:hypothetical protein [Gaiella occulta]RDI75016.1 hypothetical protein Gocc_0814 [Gaiella occulta]
MTGTLAPDAFEERLGRYLRDRAEEARAVRVGEKEVSEQAAVVARYADLFTRAQLEALRAHEDRAPPGPAERLHRLRAACEGGIVAAALAERGDALENGLLAVRIPWRGARIPLRTAQALLATTPDYADRDALGTLQLEASARLNEDRRALLAAREELDAELSGQPDPVRRSGEEKQISLQALADAVDAARVRTTPAFERIRTTWFERLLGPERDDVPTSAHAAWLRRLSTLEDTYTKELSLPVCVATLRSLGFDIERESGIRLDLDDRPQKSPRACVIASDPPRVVHLITRSQGGLHDYASFLHEAGHALHYAGCDPSLPLTFRLLARDHALTEVYSFLVESVAREPGWHALHFGLCDARAREHAEATVFLHALLFRRYSAKLGFELDFWRRFAYDGGTPAGYAEKLTAATGIRYRAEGFLADMDAGFYAADYLRAWVRSAQVRRHLRAAIGHEWWRRPETGDLLRGLFREGTRPSSEEIATRLGYDPLDTAPLEAELS